MAGHQRHAGGTPALLLAVLLGLQACGERPVATEPVPLAGAAAGWNVLLLTVDTLRADRLGSFGYALRDTSPAIDNLVASGIRFDLAMAPRAITWPSLASVLTGLYPSGHGVIQNGYEFADGLATLPKLLQTAGYQTGAFLSNMCRANHQGWDTRYCSKSIDGRVTREAVEWAQTLDPDRPFLLWAHYFGAHPPYSNGKDLAHEVLDPDYDGWLRPKSWVLDKIMIEQTPLTDADVGYLDALYDAAVIGTDETIGHLLAGLEQAGRLDRTVVIFLADHGEDLYDHHGYIYHACSVYQTGLQVPLAFVAEGLLEPGAVVGQTVELIDVAPTLLELLDLPQPDEVHGRSLVPYLERPGRPGRGRPAFSEYSKYPIHTVLADGWKLIDNPEHVYPLCFGRAPEDLYPLAPVELYNLAEDPDETTNLADRYAEKVATLQRLIEERFAGLEDRGLEQEVPEDLKEELRALGYVAN
ncbi:MAG: sulfatase [Thermoanaerobaculia bacterium]